MTRVLGNIQKSWKIVEKAHFFLKSPMWWTTTYICELTHAKTLKSTNFSSAAQNTQPEPVYRQFQHHGKQTQPDSSKVHKLRKQLPTATIWTKFCTNRFCFTRLKDPDFCQRITAYRKLKKVAKFASVLKLIKSFIFLSLWHRVDFGRVEFWQG